MNHQRDELQAHLRGVRDEGDAWVVASDGNRYWGKFGAAGLLAVDPMRGILMQHRVSWSDHGGTWGIPGGAINAGEEAIPAAIREAQEEAGVPQGAVSPQYTHVIDRGGWTYTTVIAEVLHEFDPLITDAESVALEWIPLDEVTDLPLHPGFAAAWAGLKRIVLENVAENVDLIIDELRLEGRIIERVHA